jgi:hypothetical protein
MERRSAQREDIVEMQQGVVAETPCSFLFIVRFGCYRLVLGRPKSRRRLALHRSRIATRTLAAIWLHHDRARHMRMNVAEVFVGAGRGERKREFVVGVQCLRPSEGIIVRGNAVRDIVLVVPGHGSAGLHGQRLRREGEIADRHRARRRILRPARQHDHAKQNGRRRTERSRNEFAAHCVRDDHGNLLKLGAVCR